MMPCERRIIGRMAFPIEPPIEPMLAKPTPEIPIGDGWIYEPKWDGFRSLVFRDGDELFIQSRDLKPLNRYFPELEGPLLALGGADARFVLDGEVVIAQPDGGLDFDSLLIRIHPAASRVKMLSEAAPASFVAFDCLADGRRRPARAPVRRAPRPARAAGGGSAGIGPAHPVDRPIRRWLADWFDVFEGAGLDGVIAKRAADAYEPGKRTMAKIKHERTADCVVAGFRWHKNGPGTLIGSLLLGLWNDAGQLQHVGVTSSFTMAEARRAGRVPRAVPPRWRGRPPVARVGARRGRRGRGGPPHAGCDVALEPGQGPLLGAGAPRAGVRGRVRPPPGRSLPPRRDVPALAARPVSPPTAATTSSSETPPALLADLFG